MVGAKINPAATGQFAAGFEDSFGALSRLSLTPISLSDNPSLAPADLSLALSLPTALCEDADDQLKQAVEEK